MPTDDPGFVIVYRSVEATGVDMVEGMLETEGLEPRRIGRASPALLGVGMYAVEQMIEVPAEHAVRARELIDAFEEGADDEQVAELEAEALEAPPLRDTGKIDLYYLFAMLLFGVIIGALLLFGRVVK